MMDVDDDIEIFRPDYPAVTFLNHYEIGVIHFVIVLFFILNQILFFISFYRLRNNLNSTSYKIIKYHGVLSFIQQLCHFITSIRTIVGMVPEDLLNAATGSILNGSFMGCVALILILTLNRCDIMFNNSVLPGINRETFYNIAIILCYIYSILLTTLYSIPCFNMTFDLYHYEWTYRGDYSCAIIGFEYETKSVLTFLGISTILYIIMFLKLMHLRSFSSTNNIVEVKDIKFLIHALMCFVSLIVLEILWNDVFADIYMLQVTSMIPQLIFIFTSGSNTLFTFCFVKEIRDDVINLLSCKHLNKGKVRNIVNKPNVV
uniref:7TM_GPCR_Srx domain-containing protein n=1 Tax=Parastrongyloides trichosuri TaxID=131310 RepID=A0A0N4ZI01_PARTI